MNLKTKKVEEKYDPLARAESLARREDFVKGIVADNDHLGLKGKPKRPMRPWYKDERTNAVQVHLSDRAKIEPMPSKKALFDHRPPPRVDNHLIEEGRSALAMSSSTPHATTSAPS